MWHSPKMGIRIERIKTIWYPNMMVSRTLLEKMIEHEHTIYIYIHHFMIVNVIFTIDIPRWPWDSWASLGARNGRSNSSDSAAMAKGSRSLDPAMFFLHGDSMGVPLVIIHFGVSMVHKPSSYWGSISGNHQMGYQEQFGSSLMILYAMTVTLW